MRSGNGDYFTHSVFYDVSLSLSLSGTLSLLYLLNKVIALTTRIQQIQTHLRKHNKDKHSKRGLDALYVRRRKVLDYMERKDFDSYRNVVKTLGLTH